LDINICFNWTDIGPSEQPNFPPPYTCQLSQIEEIVNTVSSQISQLISQSVVSHIEMYETVCADALSIDDQFTYQLPLGYHHFTLYQYDRAGNLITTVPPEGVKENIGSANYEHNLETKYAYNSLNQLIRQETPDG